MAMAMGTATDPIEREPRTAKDELRMVWEERARRGDFLSFQKATWRTEGGLVVGRHTKGLAAALTRATKRFIAGKSTFEIVMIPPQHGKSEAVSRAFPPFLLGRAAKIQPHAMMSGYGADLVEGFSADAQEIIRGDAYGRIFPNVALVKKARVGQWRVSYCNKDGQWSRSAGQVNAVGLGGAATGKPAHYLCIDDYCKNRQEAESEAYREMVWKSFTDTFMMRLAPVKIVIVCCTPWHVDDLQGRIKARMKENPDFPRFTIRKYPATNPDGTFLFPERYSDAHYRQAYAAAGKYSADGLLDLDPSQREGGLFQREWFEIVKESPAGCRTVRFWDLAATAPKKGKDPDWTTGVKITRAPNSIFYILDIRRIRGTPAQVKALVKQTAAIDGLGVEIRVEQEPGASGKHVIDDYRSLLAGFRYRGVRASGDKILRIEAVSSQAEPGNVKLVKGAWNSDFLDEAETIPFGKHDDQLDAAAGGLRDLVSTVESGLFDASGVGR